MSHPGGSVLQPEDADYGEAYASLQCTFTGVCKSVTPWGDAVLQVEQLQLVQGQASHKQVTVNLLCFSFLTERDCKYNDLKIPVNGGQESARNYQLWITRLPSSVCVSAQLGMLRARFTALHSAIDLVSWALCSFVSSDDPRCGILTGLLRLCKLCD